MSRQVDERGRVDEATPLAAPPRVHRGKHVVARLGISSRPVWAGITLAVLFLGRAAKPWGDQSFEAAMSAMDRDPDVELGAGGLGLLLGLGTFVCALGKVFAGPLIEHIRGRAAYLIFGFVAIITMMEIAYGESSDVPLFLAWCFYCFFSAMVLPATIATVASWFDAPSLGRVIAILTMAAKGSPLIVFAASAAVLDRGDLRSWRRIFEMSWIVFAAVFVAHLALLRPSAASMGFREPLPPGGIRERVDAQRLVQPRHQLEAVGVFEVLRLFFASSRSWYMLIGTSALFAAKMGNKFVTIYAAHSLHASDADGDLLLFLNALAGLASLLVGGAIYDTLSQRGVLLFMTLLNMVHLVTRAVHLLMHAIGALTLPSLCVFMTIYGLAAPLPTNLPFQAYAIVFGGMRHCATLVCIVEIGSSALAAGAQVLEGHVLSRHEDVLYPLVQLLLVVVATVALARFFYEDWRAQPRKDAPDPTSRRRPQQR